MRAGAAFSNPISAMAIASYVNTADDQAAQPHYGVNNNVTIDQISAFVAGGIGNHFGGFTQWTWDGVGRAFSWDNIDLRVSDRETVKGSDVLFGLSLNNNPGVQDGWNTLAAWGFPYTGSDLAPAPAAATIFDGGPAQSVLGATAFAYWDSSFYSEAGLYWTPSHRFLSAMGTDEGPGPISGAAPYFRAAYQKDFGNHNFEVGAFAFLPDLHPGGDRSTGRTDSYVDIGLDASYQYIGDNNIYTVNARYSHEQQSLDATYLLGAAANRSNTLEDFRLDAAYYWHNMIGGSAQFFDTWGSADALLYAGNSGFRPDSSGVNFQVDGTVFGRDMDVLDGRFNVRAGMQYTVYSKFDGATHGASGNDTLRLFVWTAL